MFGDTAKADLNVWRKDRGYCCCRRSVDGIAGAVLDVLLDAMDRLG